MYSHSIYRVCIIRQDTCAPHIQACNEQNTQHHQPYKVNKTINYCILLFFMVSFVFVAKRFVDEILHRFVGEALLVDSNNAFVQFHLLQYTPFVTDSQ